MGPKTAQAEMVNIVKIYIKRPGGSRTLAGDMLARFERVIHVTQFINRTNRNSGYT